MEEFYPCGVPQAVHVAGDWLVAEFLCFLAGETLFQSHAYNMKTGESFLLAPDPPIRELPYSWYVDIDDGRVVWSQLADCASGDIYLMDLETRDISKVTKDPGTGARLNLSLGLEWLAWDEYRLDENAVSNQVFDVHAANLISGETITVTLSDDGIGNMPLAGDNIIVWNETNASYLREIWALDLTSRNQYQIEASGDFPFAADLSGDLLVLSDQVSAGGTALDSSFNQPAGIPDEPCDRTRAKAGAHNRLRVYDLVTNSDVFLYYNPEARALYEARIDGKTAIWAEWAGQYPNEIDRVWAARRVGLTGRIGLVDSPLVFALISQMRVWIPVTFFPNSSAAFLAVAAVNAGRPAT
ncbi:MAG: hypothetical protein ACK2UH_16285, partial [Candidatus Promineifilaceae bacterium]